MHYRVVFVLALTFSAYSIPLDGRTLSRHSQGSELPPPLQSYKEEVARVKMKYNASLQPAATPAALAESSSRNSSTHTLHVRGKAGDKHADHSKCTLPRAESFLNVDCSGLDQLAK